MSESLSRPRRHAWLPSHDRKRPASSSRPLWAPPLNASQAQVTAAARRELITGSAALASRSRRPRAVRPSPGRRRRPPARRTASRGSTSGLRRAPCTPGRRRSSAPRMRTTGRTSDEQTAPWAIRFSVVEVKDVEIPQGMERARPVTRRPAHLVSPDRWGKPRAFDRPLHRLGRARALHNLEYHS